MLALACAAARAVPLDPPAFTIVVLHHANLAFIFSSGQSRVSAMPIDQPATTGMFSLDYGTPRTAAAVTKSFALRALEQPA